MNEEERNLAVLIMAGGVGTRFWPMSTRENPKQFATLFGDRSLLQQSYDRVSSLVPAERIFVLTNADFTALVARQLPSLPRANIIGEPARKDTAAAICLGSLIVRRQFGNPVIAVLTADHLIEPVEEFQKTILSAAAAARASGALYTFAVRPTYAATGYGYLEVGEKSDRAEEINHFQVVSFREKPDHETASQYLAGGRYFWNSGMFVWTAEAILTELQRHIPGHPERLRQAVKAWGTPAWEESLRSHFSALERVSIDYAVMEKARDVRCVCGSFSWQDMGGWQALEKFMTADGNHNHCRGRVYGIDTQGNLVYCHDPDETVALLGVDNLVVVRAGDKTLVLPKARLEELKLLVEKIQQANSSGADKR